MALPRIDNLEDNSLLDAMTQDQLRQHISATVMRLRAYRDQIDHIGNSVDLLRSELQHLLEALGENWQDDDGYARIIDGGERVTYSASDLDRLLIESPEVHGWLKQHRRVSTLKPRLTVK